MPLIDPVTMSSSIAAKGEQAQLSSKAAATQPSSLQPIQVDSSSAASQTAQHAIPGLLFALFLFRFPAIVADPVSAMSSTLPVVVLLQVGYVLLCLPAAGSQAAKTGRKARPGEKKKPGEGAGPNAISAALLSLLLTLFITPFLHAVIVLFGAPVLTHAMHTFLCAAHLAVLAFFPLFYSRGVDASAWLAVAGFRAPLDSAVGGLIGSVAGAWLGAVPIPLDWDREWQKWPVTILCGIYAGYVFGRLLGGTLLYGKRF